MMLLEKKEEPTPTARYRTYDGLNPIQIRTECRDCSGLCCVHAIPHVYRWEIAKWRALGLHSLLLTYHVSRWTKHKSRRVLVQDEELCLRDEIVKLDQVYYGYLRQRAEARIKQRSGGCVYWNRHTHKCQIYARRPASCKRWFCRKGESVSWLGNDWEIIQSMQKDAERVNRPCDSDHKSWSAVEVGETQEPLAAIESFEGS
jgi:Fe-S-cluster containining protein